MLFVCRPVVQYFRIVTIWGSLVCSFSYMWCVPFDSCLCQCSGPVGRLSLWFSSFPLTHQWTTLNYFFNLHWFVSVYLIGSYLFSGYGFVYHFIWWRMLAKNLIFKSQMILINSYWFLSLLLRIFVSFCSVILTVLVRLSSKQDWSD